MTIPASIYVWLVPSEEVQEQPGSWRIRKWDTTPFPEANFTLARSERTNVDPALPALCTALGWQGGTIHQVIEQVTRMRAALQEITKGAGAFNRDPLKHADNCIESMKSIATGALEGDWNP